MRQRPFQRASCGTAVSPALVSLPAAICPIQVHAQRKEPVLQQASIGAERRYIEAISPVFRLNHEIDEAQQFETAARRLTRAHIQRRHHGVHIRRSDDNATGRRCRG